MAWEAPGFKVPSLVSNADLSALSNQYLAVVPHTVSGQIVVAGAALEILGILQNNPAALEAAEITMNGVSKAISGAAITIGDEIEVDANGKVITLAAGVAVGYCLDTAGGADEIVTVVLK